MITRASRRRLRSNALSRNMKRAFYSAESHTSWQPPDEPADDDVPETIAGIRKFLVSSYCLSRKVDGAFVAELCWHITQIGGKGVDDLAVQPTLASKHGNRLVKHILAKAYKDPDLVMVTTPFWNKKTCQRDQAETPIHLPSAIFQSQSEQMGPNSQIAQNVQEPDERYTCQAWSEHPVKVAGYRHRHWSEVRPCSLYWDAAQYTVRDSFFGLFIRCLRTGNQELVFIVRRALH